MLDEHEKRALHNLENRLRSRALITRAFAARGLAERIPWRGVLLLTHVTATVALVTGLVATDGGLTFGGFLALCLLVFLHVDCHQSNRQED